MKNSFKQLTSLIIILSFLTFGLFAGVNVGESVASSGGPYYGWVCTDSPGQCDPNYNVTTCTWGPGSQCSDGVPGNDDQ